MPTTLRYGISYIHFREGLMVSQFSKLQYVLVLNSSFHSILIYLIHLVVRTFIIR